MENKSEYKKASDTDISGNRHNLAVFLQEIHTTPLKSLFLAGLFVILGALILWYPNTGSAKFSSDWILRIPGFLSILSAFWFLIIGLRGLFYR